MPEERTLIQDIKLQLDKGKIYIYTSNKKGAIQYSYKTKQWNPQSICHEKDFIKNLLGYLEIEKIEDVEKKVVGNHYLDLYDRKLFEIGREYLKDYINGFNQAEIERLHQDVINVIEVIGQYAEKAIFYERLQDNMALFYRTYLILRIHAQLNIYNFPINEESKGRVIPDLEKSMENLKQVDEKKYKEMLSVIRQNIPEFK